MDERDLTTRTPGTVLYMPPEVLVDKPHFTDKGDIFSLGVLMLQVATQNPPSCGLVIVKGQPEVERRAADLARLPANHPLKPLILQCLQDDPAKRPSCSEVLRLLLLGTDKDIPSVSVLLQPQCAWHMHVFVCSSAVFRTRAHVHCELHQQQQCMWSYCTAATHALTPDTSLKTALTCSACCAHSMCGKPCWKLCMLH